MKEKIDFKLLSKYSTVKEKHGNKRKREERRKKRREGREEKS